MAKYSIEDTTLTALGDAIREKTGKLTREGYVDAGKFVVENLLKAQSKDYYLPTGTKKVKVKKIYFKNHISVSVLDSGGSSILTPNGSTVGWDFYKEEITELVVESDKGLYCFRVYNNGAWNNGEAFDGEFEITSYDADENIIQVPGEVKNTMTPIEMAETINEMLMPPPEEAFTITAEATYAFPYNNWNWFINNYADKIITKDITKSDNMFYQSSELESIPFDVNFKPSSTYHTTAYMFYGCTNLKTIPKLVGLKPDAMNDMFSSCQSLVEIPEESVAGIDWSYMDSRTSTYSTTRANTFKNCYSLRKFPMSFIAHGNPVATYSIAIYYSLFSYCFALDELVGLPVIHRNASWTSNAFSYTFQNCYRLKDIIFETNEDGSPIKIDTWSKQTIDLSGTLGYGTSSAMKQAGFTTDKQVTDDATYQALKDDPDWWTTDVNYSRYNHDSAVRTINSLPDTSAKGGNTIKFKGALGTKTDGGAINTLTAEEIAVATAKGWTVTIS